jgi:ankyrin repeat protein
MAGMQGNQDDHKRSQESQQNMWPFWLRTNLAELREQAKKYGNEIAEGFVYGVDDIIRRSKNAPKVFKSYWHNGPIYFGHAFRLRNVEDCGKYDEICRKADGHNIFECASNGHVHGIKAWIAYRPSILASKDKRGKTPLMHACISGDLTTIQEIARRYHWNIDHQDQEGNTALIYAAQRGQAENLFYFLKDRLGCKANINIRNNKGETALICAVQNKHLNDAKNLLECKAKINARDNEGRSALYFALIQENYPMIHLLLEAKALVPLIAWDIAQQVHAKLKEQLKAHEEFVHINGQMCPFISKIVGQEILELLEVQGVRSEQQDSQEGQVQHSQLKPGAQASPALRDRERKEDVELAPQAILQQPREGQRKAKEDAVPKMQAPAKVPKNLDATSLLHACAARRKKIPEQV